MKNKNHILLIGQCGSGKTWVMKSIIKAFEQNHRHKIGKFYYHTDGTVIVIGKYDNTTFEGSDRLSMAVMADVVPFLNFNKGKKIIAEGDRFTNSVYIAKANPIIVKIMDDGKEGREKRKSEQTDRQIRMIRTRINNIKADHEVETSLDALILINNLIYGYDKN
jgi:ABC-type dipeptide/oligopeptide/nickel transport system ATPase component